MHIAAPSRRLLASVLCLVCSLAPMRVRAEQHGDEAESAFARGKALMDEGRIAEACSAFADSYGMDPALGTLLNLAWCHERQGRRAQAITEYLRAESESTASGQDKRARFARQRLDALRPLVAFVQVELSDTPPACEVRLDGSAIGLASLKHPIPVDPGEHWLLIRANAHRPFLHRLSLQAQPGVVRIIVPRLEPLGAEPPARTSPGPAHARSTYGYVIGGLGIAAVGAGAWFGLRTMSLERDAESKCQGRYCTDEGLELTRDANRSATASTVSFVIGGVALAAGAWLVLSSPRASTRVSGGASLAPGGGAIRASVSF